MGNQEKRIQALDKALKALEYRKAGITYIVIAQNVGYNSAQAAWKAVRSALKRTIQEPANELRRIEVERIDAALASIWVQVKQGNLPAIDRFVRLSERRANLLGLDEPKKQEISGNISGQGGGPITLNVVYKDKPKQNV